MWDRSPLEQNLCIIICMCIHVIMSAYSPTIEKERVLRWALTGTSTATYTVTSHSCFPVDLHLRDNLISSTLPLLGHLSIALFSSSSLGIWIVPINKVNVISFLSTFMWRGSPVEISLQAISGSSITVVSTQLMHHPLTCTIAELACCEATVIEYHLLRLMVSYSSQWW